MALTLYYCYSGNTKLHSVCVVQLHVTLLLILQSLDWLAAFQLELLQAIFFP
jgi:hypothetical protein